METPPSSPKQPDPKKPKMSTTTNSDDDDDLPSTAAASAVPERKQRYKRRKIAIFFAYCGVGYQGMQKNPGAKTIEGDLEEALFLSGAVPEQDRGIPKRFDWARSARTDKGVSAVGQVVSGRFYVDPPGLIDRLHSNLPQQIRIFGYKRVTASFNAKKFCDRRRYVYLIPVFALDPCSHPDRESVLASLGSGSELVKCLECSERGRKVEGVMGKRRFEPNSDNCEVISHSDIGISSNNGTAVSNTEDKGETRYNNSNTDGIRNNGAAGNEGVALTPELAIEETNSEAKAETGISSNDESALSHSGDRVANGVSLVITDCNNSDTGDTMNNGAADDEGDVGEKKVEGELDVCGNGEEKLMTESGFCYGEQERERFNRILKRYEGTHNFHNFTTRTKAEDPSAKRYIISFDAKTVVTVEGIEFVKCEVIGQSFMLHQIRKMVGLAVAIMRDCAPESLIETALQQDVNINVPTAPEVGLYLDECFFASYNQKWKDTHEEVSMKAYAEEAESFKMNHIYSHIASTEHKEGVVGLWLHSLNHRNYPDLRIVSNGGASDANCAGASDTNCAGAEVVPE